MKPYYRLPVNDLVRRVGFLLLVTLHILSLWALAGMIFRLTS